MDSLKCPPYVHRKIPVGYCSSRFSLDTALLFVRNRPPVLLIINTQSRRLEKLDVIQSHHWKIMTEVLVFHHLTEH